MLLPASAKKRVEGGKRCESSFMSRWGLMGEASQSYFSGDCSVTPGTLGSRPSNTARRWGVARSFPVSFNELVANRADAAAHVESSHRRTDEVFLRLVYVRPGDR